MGQTFLPVKGPSGKRECKYNQVFILCKLKIKKSGIPRGGVEVNSTYSFTYGHKKSLLTGRPNPIYETLI
jgi:hypothetical protein